MPSIKTQSELEATLFKIQLELSDLKSNLIPSELLLNEIEKMKKSQEDTNQDLKEIKKMLLDPNDGIIVKVNKNTEYREEKEKEYETLYREHRDLVNWKSGVVKFLWMLMGTIVAGISYIVNKINGFN